MPFKRTSKVAAHLLLTVLCVLPQGGANAQTGSVIAGAGAVYNLPVGSLHNRYRGAMGGMVYVGAEVSPEWTWVGKFEYVELTTPNTDALRKVVTLGQGTAAERYTVPLPGLAMKLTAASLTAEAMLNLHRSAGMQAHAVVGFGFTNWVNTRGAYYGTLVVDSAGTGNRVKALELAVPENRQEDWSGTLNVGIGGAVRLVDPLWLTAGVDYKIIVGELWQTLDLDLENVAGMQFLSARVGVRADL